MGSETLRNVKSEEGEAHLWCFAVVSFLDGIGEGARLVKLIDQAADIFAVLESAFAVGQETALRRHQ